MSTITIGKSIIRKDMISLVEIPVYTDPKWTVATIIDSKKISFQVTDYEQAMIIYGKLLVAISSKETTFVPISSELDSDSRANFSKYKNFTGAP